MKILICILLICCNVVTRAQTVNTLKGIGDLGTAWKTTDTTLTIIAVADTANSENVYWMKVYRVVWLSGNAEKLNHNIKYLDINKQPLPKHLIIFKSEP